MANVSAEDAQTNSVCQFCKESFEIKWKCINCNLFLCKLCNSRIHSNIALLKDHIAINLEDCGSEYDFEISRKLDLTKQSCSIHSEEKCVLYCNDCDRSVCSDCVIQDHKNQDYHDFCKMNHIYDKKLKMIKDMKQEIKSGILFFQREEENLEQVLSDGNKQYTENREKIIEIKEKTIEFKDNVVKYADGLLSDLDEEWKPTEDIIKKELDSVKQRKDGLKERNSQLDQSLESHYAIDIFVTSNCLDKSMPDKTLEPIELNQRKFIPGKYSYQPISVLFGSVFKVPDFQLVQSYQTNLDVCSNFIKCEDNTAYIGSFGRKFLQKVTIEKDRMKQEHGEKEVKLPLLDMTLMDNGDILISSMEQDLKLYTKDGEMKTYKTFSSLYTLGIHIDKQSEIFVGLGESGDMTNPSEDSIRKVVQINKKGIQLHTYEYGTDNKRLFTWPARICTNNKFIFVVDYIGVLDYLSYIWHRSGRVVVIDKGGQLQWIYNSSFEKFHPSDIAVTSTDMVIVTDSTNHALHVLSPTGDLIVCKVVTDLGIYQPYSLSICKDDEIWIATWNSKIHALKLRY
ncbi:Hypothetical predicted protein [Mytilus galloprovincialis]|uniref:B box-type domain-containing protein n=1 Tax=Mytilus galloprovincialis TaxID=29158 RepID=A0A8B6FRL7_MYTGA|nr:Hypothetical predicted protein [Mytilus galloprovincialis]